jgi:hypothetical protein
MAKKATPKATVNRSTRSTPAASTPVRNSAIPKAKPAAKVITHEMIAQRAYEISQSPLCGSESDNWFRAERELKGL